MLKSGDYFFSLFDGKQPLLMWLFGIFSTLFSDPLFGGRLVSILFSLFSAILIYLISKKLFSPPKAFLASIIFLLSTGFLFYGRQALMESAITTFGLWNFYLTLGYLHNPSLKNCLYLGLIWGIGLNIKLSFSLFIVAAFAVVIVHNHKQISYLLLSALIALLLLVPLMSQPDFAQILFQNNRFSLTFAEILKFPFLAWWKNVLSILDISTTQILGLMLIPLVINFKHHLKSPASTYLLSTLVLYLLFTRNPSPRYLIPFLPMGIILSFTTFKPLYIIPSLVYFVILDILLLFSPYLYFQFLSTVSAYSQKEIYYGTFTSGFGVKPAVDYVVNKIGNQPAVVGIRLDAGNPENSVFMYLSKYPHIKVVYLDDKSFSPTPDNISVVSPVPIYFITRANQLAGLDRFLIFEASFPKPLGDATQIYRIRTVASDSSI